MRVSISVADSNSLYFGRTVAKWSRMRQRLLDDGLAEGDVERVVTPIGLAGVGGKDPAVIAVSVAADLVRRIHAAAGPAPAARHVED